MRLRSRSTPAPRRLLTETELEVMNILWRLGEGTVAEVLEELPAGRRLAYTSVSTMLRILEQKEAVESRPEGRRHVYRPRIEKEAYQAVSLRHLISGVFGGAPVALVRRLLEEERLTPRELEELRKLIARRSS